MDRESHADEGAFGSSKRSVETLEKPHSRVSGEEESSRKGSTDTHDASRYRLKSGADAQEDVNGAEDGNGADTDVQKAPSIEAQARDFKQLRSLFEDDDSGLDGIFVVVESSEDTMGHGGGSTGSEKESLGVEAYVEKQDTEDDYDGDTRPATAAPTSRGGQKKEEEVSETSISAVPSDIVVHNVSSLLKVTALTSAAQLPHKSAESVPEKLGTEAAPDMGVCEQPALDSLQDLSKQVSGRVERIVSLFECRSGESLTGDGREVELKAESRSIRTGLSCDSGVLDIDSEDDNLKTTNLNAQAAVKDDAEDKGLKESEEVQNDGDQVAESPILEDMVDCVESRETSGLATEEAVDLMHYASDESSSTSVGSSEEASGTFSHLVNSCTVM
ncbi:hypothetical protein FGB62_28g29 [Gracilaria domingensis]|nr:hypothetical protein FGB62_28g29 [Gracilaria domingensis]